MIALQFGTCDGAKLGAEMSDHCCHGDIGKTKCIIIKCSQVQVVNCSEELFLDLLLDCHSNGEFLDGCIEEMDVLLSGRSIGPCSMIGDQSWMCWELKGNASDDNVLRNGHDKAKMAMATAT